MKKIIALLLCACMCFSVLSACGTKTEEPEAPVTEQTETKEEPVAEKPAEEPSEPAEEAPAEETTSGGHVANLMIGTISAPDTFSILSQSGAFGKFNYNSIVYANFFYPDADNNMQPYFLTSYEISDDAKELHMTFPTTAVWHDGEPVTVDDIVFTFEYRRDVMESTSLRNLTEVRVEGEDAVTLVFSEPDAYYFVKNAGLTMHVLPKHIWEGVEDYDTYAEPDAAIGCGPYKLVDVDLDAGTLYYEAVPENQFLGELTVDAITLKYYSSMDALLMAMANGEIDLMYNYASPVDYTLLDVIADSDVVDPGMSDFTGCSQVTFGMSQGPNLEHAFREAVVKSLNWELLAQLLNGEYGQVPGTGILPPSCAGFDETLPMMYQDLEEARTLLDEAGFADVDGDGMREMPDGSKLTYKVCSQYSKSRLDQLNRIGEILVASLREIGIDAYYDQESLVSSEVNGAMIEENAYDMLIGFTTSGVASYRTAYWYFMPRDIVGGGMYKWGNSYNNEDLNAAYLKLMNATSNDEYLEAVKELQTLGSEELFAFALCWEKCFFPYRTDRFDGLENYPSIGVVHAETFYNITEK